MTADEMRRLRRKNKLTQQAFAELIGASIYTVRKWEGGQLNVSRLAEKAITCAIDRLHGK